MTGGFSKEIDETIWKRFLGKYYVKFQGSVQKTLKEMLMKTLIFPKEFLMEFLEKGILRRKANGRFFEQFGKAQHFIE